MGSNVPPITPIRRRRPPSGGVIAAAARVVSGSVPLVGGVAEGPGEAEQRPEDDQRQQTEGLGRHRDVVDLLGGPLGQQRKAHPGLRLGVSAWGLGPAPGRPTAYSLAEARSGPRSRPATASSARRSRSSTSP